MRIVTQSVKPCPSSFEEQAPLNIQKKLLFDHSAVAQANTTDRTAFGLFTSNLMYSLPSADAMLRRVLKETRVRTMSWTWVMWALGNLFSS